MFQLGTVMSGLISPPPGANRGILQNRPDVYVPFKVPVFDEEATRLFKTLCQLKFKFPGMGLAALQNGSRAARA